MSWTSSFRARTRQENGSSAATKSQRKHAVKCINVFVCVQMVSNLFVVHAEVTVQQRRGHVRKSNTVTRKYQAPTVSNKFQQSLLELVEKMER